MRNGVGCHGTVCPRLLAMRLLMVSAAVSAGLLVPALPASAASTSGPAARWSEVPAGRPTAGTALSGVVAVGAPNRWAVGSVTAPGAVRPLVEHDRGYGGTRVPVPDAGAGGGQRGGLVPLDA